MIQDTFLNARQEGTLNSLKKYICTQNGQEGQNRHCLDTEFLGLFLFLRDVILEAMNMDGDINSK